MTTEAVDFGILVDDSPYWQKRVPRTLSKLGIKLKVFSRYEDVQVREQDAHLVKFVLGDYHVRQSSMNGVEGIRQIQQGLAGNDKCSYYIFSVLKEREVRQKCLSQPPDWIKFIYKGTSRNEFSSLLLESMRT